MLSSTINHSNIYYYSLAGRLIAELSGTTPSTSILLTDALGSVLATFSNTANTAALLGNQTYGPYGSQQYQSGSMGTTKGFTGQYNDTVTGLDYYNARYYDPVAGVFLSADSVQGNGQGMNPYGYVQGNPETWSDPTGQVEVCSSDCNGGGGDSTGSSTIEGSTSSGGDGEGASTTLSQDWYTWTADLNLDPTVSNGNTTYDLSSSGELTVTTVSLDGSSTTTGYMPDDPQYTAMMGAYTQALDALDQGNDFTNQSVYAKHGIHMTSHDVSTSTSTSGGGHQPPGGRPPTAPPPPPSGDGGKMRMNPQNIGFTQKTCNNRGGGYTVRGNIAALQNGSLSPDDLPPIRVFQKTSTMDSWGPMTKNGFTGTPTNLIEGQWYSLDNRRLFTFQQAGITDIPVEDVSDKVELLQSQSWKFTTQSWGIDIQLLGDTGC